MNEHREAQIQQFLQALQTIISLQATTIAILSNSNRNTTIASTEQQELLAQFLQEIREKIDEISNLILAITLQNTNLS